MPIYEYKAVTTEENPGCEYCLNVFEHLQKTGGLILETCPQCGGPVKKIISRVGVSFGLDYRARGTGLHKLVKRDTGTYEKMY